MFKHGATRPALLLLAGVLAVQWLPALPPRGWCVAGGLAALSLSALRTRWRCAAWCLLGVAWACWSGSVAMDARLPRALEGQDVQVTGTVVDLPGVRDEATTFQVSVEQARHGGEPIDLRGRIRVNWYEGAPQVLPCSRWQLTLRVKRPRGLVNPGGSDSERSALEHGLVATAYVRDDEGNRQLQLGHCIDGARDAISRGIAKRVRDERDAALLRALAVGDTRGLTSRDWESARANGISHLLAISGFHVGVAAVFGVWLARLLYLAWPALGLWIPRLQIEAALALPAAGVYSALAGFGLPTVRSLLMIAVVALAHGMRRASSGRQSLALALFVVVLFDPLCVLSAGFWLSFAGVAFLMLCLATRGGGLRGYLHELTAAQGTMTVALLPLTMWFFGRASLVGALSNLFAVPLVSFVIVPGSLLGMLLLGIVPALADAVLWAAGWVAHGQWWLLDRMAGWPGAHWYLPEVRWWALLLAMAGASWLMMPRGVPLRWLGGLLFLPLLLPQRLVPEEGGFRLWMLDVGQGLSVVVRTRNHALVYDAGARYPSDFDLGEAAVVPSLHALGVRRLDVLMASHADNDHAGGIPAVAADFPEAARYSGEPERLPLPMKPCVPGQTWTWDGVTLSVLSSGASGGPANDRSCVLLVQGRGGRALLTGDITSRIEPSVLEALPPGPPLVLSVPHHGSRTSSSAAFLAGAEPTLALISSGWRNRFRHPHPLIVQRYENAGVPWLNTATSGAIEVDFPPDAAPYVAARWRQRQARYWRERP